MKHLFKSLSVRIPLKLFLLKGKVNILFMSPRDFANFAYNHQNMSHKSLTRSIVGRRNNKNRISDFSPLHHSTRPLRPHFQTLLTFGQSWIDCNKQETVPIEESSREGHGKQEQLKKRTMQIQKKKK